MTAFNHAITQALLLDLLGVNGAVIGIWASAATYPDLAPLEETRHGNYDGLYLTLHYKEPLMWIIPPTALHLLVDRLMHRPDGKWYWWAYVAEVVTDAACIAYFLGKWGWL